MRKTLSTHARGILGWRQLTKFFVAVAVPGVVVLPELELPTEKWTVEMGSPSERQTLERGAEVLVIGGNPSSGRIQLRSGLSVEDVSWTPLGLWLDPIQGAGVNLGMFPLYLLNGLESDLGGVGVMARVSPRFFYEGLQEGQVGLRSGYDPFFGGYAVAAQRLDNRLHSTFGVHAGPEGRIGGGLAGQARLFHAALGSSWSGQLELLALGSFSRSPSIGSPDFPTPEASQEEGGATFGIRLSALNRANGHSASLTPFVQVQRYRYRNLPATGAGEFASQESVFGGASWTFEGTRIFRADGAFRVGEFKTSAQPQAFTTAQIYQAIATPLGLKRGTLEPSMEIRGAREIGAYPGLGMRWKSRSSGWEGLARWTHRLPTLLERGFAIPGMSRANPDLRAERSVQFQAGYRGKMPAGGDAASWGIEAKGAFRDRVIATQVRDGIFSRRNFGEALEGAIVGSVVVEPLSFWGVEGEIEGGASRIFSTGERFPYRPNWRLSIINKISLGRFVDLEGRVMALGSSEVAGIRIDPYAIAVLGLSGRYREASFGVWVENPTRRSIISDPFQFPVERNFRMSFQWLL